MESRDAGTNVAQTTSWDLKLFVDRDASVQEINAGVDGVPGNSGGVWINSVSHGLKSTRQQ
jgi:hypothetical protein